MHQLKRFKLRARRQRIPHPVHARPVQPRPLRLDEFLDLVEFRHEMGDLPAQPLR